MLRCGPLLGLSILVAERCWAVILCGECSALDRVVGEDAVSAPGSGAGDGGEFGAVPAVAAFDVVDPAFGSGSPFDLVAEGSSVFELAARGAGFLLRAMATPRTPSSCRSSSTLASPYPRSAVTVPGAAGDPLDRCRASRRPGGCGSGPRTRRVRCRVVWSSLIARCSRPFAWPVALLSARRALRATVSASRIAASARAASSPVIRCTVAWASSRCCASRSFNLPAIARARRPAVRRRFRDRVRVASPSALIRSTARVIFVIAFGQRARVGRVGDVGLEHRGVGADLSVRSSFAAAALANGASFNPATAASPHRVVFISVVGWAPGCRTGSGRTAARRSNPATSRQVRVAH